MRILYLAPRLDVPFKYFGPVSDERGPITPLRQNWIKFTDMLIEFCKQKKWHLDIEEKPLWAFREDEYNNNNYDYLIIPHKEKHNFNPIGKATNLYLMQAPFPEYFSLDTNGWAGNLSYLNNLYDAWGNGIESKKIWDKLRSRVLSNISKFEQPTKQIDQEDFVLFICQLPHDETIKYHSTVSVEGALHETIHHCGTMGRQLVVKGHPANPDSMKTLKEMTNNSRNIWVEDVSIHSCIKKSSHCVTVNSGAGMEVIMHKKPVFTFGVSEYDSVAHKRSLFDFLITEKDVDEELYKRFIFNYMMELIDPSNIHSYHYVFSRFLGIN